MEEYSIKTNKDGSKILVRDVQNVLLTMLKDIDKVCKKHDIPYWLTGGSALGAVRHKGFIPWDDDADIGMMREDYERFLSVASDLGDSYVIHSYEQNKKCNVLVPMKVRKKDTYCEEFNVLLKNKCKDCDGLFIDIFVIDYISNNKIKDFVWRVRNGILMLVIALLENIGLNPIPLKNRFLRNAKTYGRKNKDSDLIGFDLTWTFNSFLHPVVYKKESVFPVQYVSFEDTQLPIPKRPKDMLDIEVSPSHMSFPPEKDRVPKHLKEARF